MKSITLALMAYVFVSYVFDSADAKSATLGGVTYGETNKDVSMFTYSTKKNQYSEQVCKENNYNAHYLVGLCCAFCYESTIKDRASKGFDLPDGTPCINGQTCKKGHCGEIHDPLPATLEGLDRYIDNAPALKDLSPELIAAIKAELRKFKSAEAGKVSPYLEKLENAFSGLDKYYNVLKFDKTH